jgi:ABC-type multidrug transport system fused ATPase/permease subunit
MSAEPIDGNHPRYRVPETNLNELKDTAVMLTMAGEHLCEEVNLKKIGSSIEKNLEILRNHVEDLRKQLVGKKNREDEPPVDEDLEQISHIASLFQKTDSDTKHKCVEGELGEELGVKTVSLATSINVLKEKVEGKPVRYTKTESALGMIGRLKFVISAIATLFKLTFKMLALLILICLILFSYLFFTMDKKKDLSKKIHQDSAYLSSKQADLSRINDEIKEIREEIKRVKKIRDRSSQEKIGLMDLNLKVIKLVEEQEMAENDLRSRRRAMEESRRKLEEMKQKTFMERLLGPIYKLILPLEKKWNEYFGS